MENSKLPGSKPAKSPLSALSGKGLNVWQIVSIILAVVVVLLITQRSSGSLAGELGPEEAADRFVGFVSKVYGPQIGQPVLKEVIEENGLYKITIGVTLPTGPQDQVVYLTKDANFFTAAETLLDIQDIESRFDDLQQQGGVLPANLSPGQNAPSSAPGATIDVGQEDVDLLETEEQESGDETEAVE